MTNSKTPEYRVWAAMKRRCYNKNCRQYKWYGARGISVCSEWIVDFITFLSDMGTRPEGSQLERVNNDLGYSPTNCVWATRKQQMNNTRATRVLEFSGQRRSVAQWADVLGIPSHRIFARLDKCGMTIKEALSTPEKMAEDRTPQRKYALGDEVLTLSEWSRRTGLKYSTMYARIGRGIPLADALTSKPWTSGPRRPRRASGLQRNG